MMRFTAVALMIWLVTAVPGWAQEPLRVESARRQVTLNGYSRPHVTMTLAAEVAGKITVRRYEIGQAVGEAPFFEIDTTFIDFQIASTRESIAQLLVAQRRSASRAGFLQKEFDRFETLVQRDSAAGSRRDAAAEELTQARLEGETVTVQLAQARINLEELQERRRRHLVMAPKGWKVTGRFAESGEIVQPNAPLATLADFRTLVVPLSVSPEELVELRQLPAVFPALLENRPVGAVIRWVNPQFDEKTRKIGIELTLQDYAGERRGGLVFSLPLAVNREGLQVPREALINRYEHPRVVIKAGGEAVPVEVLGEGNGKVTIAAQPRLQPGTELAAP